MMKILVSAIALATTMSSFNSLAAPESYGVLFLDRSSSMNTLRPDGQSRCSFSKQQAVQKVSKFFLDATINGQQLNVKTFASGGQIQSLTNGFAGFNAAMMALYQLDPEGCSGLTALAQAMCDGADELRANYSTEAANGALLRVYGSTDGSENDSPISSCGGSNWQTSVTSKYLFELPPVQFNATIYTGTVQNILANKDKMYVLDVSSASQSVSSTPTFQFLKQLSIDTGGTYEEISDSDGGDPGDW